MNKWQDKQTTIAAIVEIESKKKPLCRRCGNKVINADGVLKVLIETEYHDPPKWYVVCDDCAHAVERAWASKLEYIGTFINHYGSLSSMEAIQ